MARTRERGFSCELLAAARVFRRFLEFPLADLMISGRIPPVGLVIVDHIEGEEHLHFTVTSQSVVASPSPNAHSAREVEVQWGVPPSA